MQTVRLNYAGAMIELPYETVIKNWLDSLDIKSAASTKHPTSIPNIGGYWAGQGGIFAGLIRGDGDKPDRLLIVPTDAAAEFAPSVWGPDRQQIKDCDDRRYGLVNTKSMAAAGSDLASKCLALEIEGHSDFYLPSRDELRLCCMNVPEIFEQAWYWTSTQYSAYLAFSQNFDDGYQSDYDKYSKLRARAVRSIQVGGLVIQ